MQSTLNEKYIPVFNIVLGAILGLLVVLPLALQGGPGTGFAAKAGGGLILGALIGYRRRRSRVFFYFTLISIPLLAAVLSSQLR